MIAKISQRKLYLVTYSHVFSGSADLLELLADSVNVFPNDVIDFRITLLLLLRIAVDDRDRTQ